METLLHAVQIATGWLLSDVGWLVMFGLVPLLVFVVGALSARRRRGREDMVARQIRLADQARREVTR